MITLERAQRLSAHLAELQNSMNATIRQAYDEGLNVTIHTLDVTHMNKGHCDMLAIDVTASPELLSVGDASGASQ